MTTTQIMDQLVAARARITELDRQLTLGCEVIKKQAEQFAALEAERDRAGKRMDEILRELFNIRTDRDALSEKLVYAEDILNVLVAKGIIEKPTP